MFTEKSHNEAIAMIIAKVELKYSFLELLNLLNIKMSLGASFKRWLQRNMQNARFSLSCA